MLRNTLSSEQYPTCFLVWELEIKTDADSTVSHWIIQTTVNAYIYSFSPYRFAQSLIEYTTQHQP
jgi:hypothetical protein